MKAKGGEISAKKNRGETLTAPGGAIQTIAWTLAKGVVPIQNDPTKILLRMRALEGGN